MKYFTVNNLRQLLFFLLLGLLSCQKKTNKNDISAGTSTKVSPGLSSKVVFENEAESYVKYRSNGTLSSEIKNVRYYEEYLDQGDSLDYYLVKETQNINSTRGVEGWDTEITINLFNLSDNKLVKTIQKYADKVSFSTDFILSTRYRCCGGEDSCELSGIWDDKAFLTFNEKYYLVDIPNSPFNFFMGYLNDVRNEKELILGELRFARSTRHLAPDKKHYTKENKYIGKIIFKAKTKEIFGQIIPFTPDINLNKNTEQDEIIDYPDHSEIRLWSYNNIQSLDGINYFVMTVSFTNEKIIKIDIPVKNGLLFGSNKTEQTIFIED